MAVNIGPKIGIEGEPEYRKQINNIIQQTKTLKGEMDKLTSSFDKGKASIKQNKEQHKLLEDQISKQKEKVKALSEMLQKSKDKFGENADQTLKWKDAVNKAQTDLNKMEDTLKNLPTTLQLVGDKMQDIGGKVKKFGDNMYSAGRTLTRNVTTPIVGLATAAVKTTADFDTEMSKVQAISGASAAEFTQLRDKAIDMGDKTKFSASESAQAFEYMAMAGWKTEQMMGGIEGIMNLAAASGEELGTTSDIVTDALTAFGYKAEDAGRFADILAAASSNSNTNVAMLGQSFKYAAAPAGALGYSAEDVAIALGLMANSGIKADMAGTSLRNVFQRMAKPTKESGMAIERLGLALADDEGRMYSFREVMGQLREGFAHINMSAEDYDAALDELDADLESGALTQSKYDAALEELNKQAFGAEGAEKARAAAMLGGARAMSGLLAIAQATQADYDNLTAAVDNSSQAFAMLADGSIVPMNEALQSGQQIIAEYTGSAEAMAGSMLNNVSGDITLLKSQLQTLAIQFGDILVPVLRDTVVPALEGLIEKLRALTPEQKEQILKIAGIVAAVGPVLMIIGKIISIIGTLIIVIGGIMLVLNPVQVAFVAFFTIIGAMIAVFLANWETAKTTFIQYVTDMKNMFVTIWTAIGTFLTTAMTAIKTTISTAITAVKTIWTTAWNAIKTTVITIFTNLQTSIRSKMTAVKTTIDSIIKTIKNTFKNLINDALQWGKDLIGKLVEGIKSKISSVKEGIGSVAGAIREVIHFSKPDTGPLRPIDKWMPDMMELLAYGMTHNLGVVRSAATGIGSVISDGINPTMPADIAIRRSVSTDDIYNATSAANAGTADELRRLNDALTGGATNVTVMLTGDAGKMLKVLSVENSRRSRATGYNSLSGATI